MSVLIGRLERIARRSVALLRDAAALNHAALVARPAPGKWSILEIIEHLVVAEEDVVGDFARLGDLAKRPRGFGNRVLYLIRHPVCGPISVSQGIRMLGFHLDRHVAQVRRMIGE